MARIKLELNSGASLRVEYLEGCEPLLIFSDEGDYEDSIIGASEVDQVIKFLEKYKKEVIKYVEDLDDDDDDDDF